MNRSWTHQHERTYYTINSSSNATHNRITDVPMSSAAKDEQHHDVSSTKTENKVSKQAKSLASLRIPQEVASGLLTRRILVHLEDNELGRSNSKNVDCSAGVISNACIANPAVWGIGPARAVVAAISERKIFVNQLACSCFRVDLDRMEVATFKLYGGLGQPEVSCYGGPTTGSAGIQSSTRIIDQESLSYLSAYADHLDCRVPMNEERPQIYVRQVPRTTFGVLFNTIDSRELQRGIGRKVKRRWNKTEAKNGRRLFFPNIRQSPEQPLSFPSSSLFPPITFSLRQTSMQGNTGEFYDFTTRLVPNDCRITNLVASIGETSSEDDGDDNDQEDCEERESSNKKTAYNDFTGWVGEVYYGGSVKWSLWIAGGWWLQIPQKISIGVSMRRAKSSIVLAQCPSRETEHTTTSFPPVMTERNNGRRGAGKRKWPFIGSFTVGTAL
ncbi:hypothetical protein DFS33DRAFT_1269168 [Desarmillaria ectypa]|nr:hypothetical protein DFS33DRAFT_1269168 [Desarmillaria ectypa]